MRQMADKAQVLDVDDNNDALDMLSLIDGSELARRLRAIPETARFVLVALTGYGQPEDKEPAIQAGFDHHLVKPVNVEALGDFVGRIGDGAPRSSAVH
jgi:CheY-like chemotaxis protein